MHRFVHDILLLKRRDNPRSGALISFIQHGTVETGWKYEAICPYCTLTLGFVEDSADTFTNMELHRAIYQLTRPHIRKECKASGYRVNVEKSLKPLATETVIKES